MVKLKRSTIRAIDELFDMTSDYVLNFIDRIFAEFFEHEFGISIGLPSDYHQAGTSNYPDYRRDSGGATRMARDGGLILPISGVAGV